MPLDPASLLNVVPQPSSTFAADGAADAVGSTLGDPGERLIDALSEDRGLRAQSRIEWARSLALAHRLKRLGSRRCVAAGFACALMAPQPYYLEYMREAAVQAILVLWIAGLLLAVAALTYRSWLNRMAQVQHIDVGPPIGNTSSTEVSEQQLLAVETLTEWQSQAEGLFAQEQLMESVALGCGAFGMGWFIIHLLGIVPNDTAWFPLYVVPLMVIAVHHFTAWWWLAVWLMRLRLLHRAAGKGIQVYDPASRFPDLPDENDLRTSS